MDAAELRAKLEQIAALASSLPFPMTSLGFEHGSRGAFEALSAMPGAALHAHVTVRPDRSYVIESVRIEIGAVAIRAQYERPATDAEREQAQTGGRDEPGYRVAAVRT